MRHQIQLEPDRSHANQIAVNMDLCAQVVVI